MKISVATEFIPQAPLQSSMSKAGVSFDTMLQPASKAAAGNKAPKASSQAPRQAKLAAAAKLTQEAPKITRSPMAGHVAAPSDAASAEAHKAFGFSELGMFGGYGALSTGGSRSIPSAGAGSREVLVATRQSAKLSPATKVAIAPAEADKGSSLTTPAQRLVSANAILTVARASAIGAPTPLAVRVGRNEEAVEPLSLGRQRPAVLRDMPGKLKVTVCEEDGFVHIVAAGAPLAPSDIRRLRRTALETSAKLGFDLSELTVNGEPVFSPHEKSGENDGPRTGQ